MTVVEVLEGAKKLLIEAGWVQHFDYGPGGFCAIGAIDDIAPTGGVYTKAVTQLIYVIGCSVPTWNDAVGRTKEEVLQAFDKAIELAKKEE